MKINKRQLDRHLLNLQIAFEAVLVNKVRTVLTALGIIFGVAAVISMLAIGNGAKKEVLAQMKMIGVNNIVIKAKKTEIKQKNSDQEESQQEKEAKSKEKLSAGLCIAEANSIRNIIPNVHMVSVETHIITTHIYDTRNVKGVLAGVNEDFFKIFQLQTEIGFFPTQRDYHLGTQVCVIGHNIKSRLFPTEPAIGKEIKSGNAWYKIIGVLSYRGQMAGVTADMGISDYDLTIFIPIQSYLKRHNDPSIITKRILNSWDDEVLDPNRNQVETIVVQVDDSKLLKASAELVDKMLKRKHAQSDDYTISIPELLLQQEQKTTNIFNVVLGAIASISLIVGGIGIMNIMLASVIERTKEIGIRRSIGAKAQDVVFQFLAEAAIISLIGGLIGVFLGLILAYGISKMTDIPTIVTWFSVVISFLVSAAVGIVFGYMPAQRAAKEDIIVALRHE
jgi:putative ABC transport system permease protein